MKSIIEIKYPAVLIDKKSGIIVEFIESGVGKIIGFSKDNIPGLGLYKQMYQAGTIYPRWNMGSFKKYIRK